MLGGIGETVLVTIHCLRVRRLGWEYGGDGGRIICISLDDGAKRGKFWGKMWCVDPIYVGYPDCLVLEERGEKYTMFHQPLVFDQRHGLYRRLPL